MTKIICISGKARHGKDTTAAYLQAILERCGKNVLVIHNADLLKYLCKQLFGWNGVKDKEGRQILQYVGTDVVREKDPAFWVNFIIKIAQLFVGRWDYIVVPDCRFPNEIDNFKNNGFTTFHIRVVRDGFDNGLTREQKIHLSETALDNTVPDYTLMNSQDLVYLFNLIVSMVRLNNQIFDIPDSQLIAMDKSNE